MRARARKVEMDGIVFDSGEEAAHYADLKLQQRAGLISKLQVHPEFKLIVNGVLICKFKPDFVFHDKDDRVRVQDYKGKKRSKKTGKLLPRVDRDFSLKRKLMRACFALEVEIV